MAVMASRHGLALEATLVSDVAPINGLIRAAIDAAPGAITAMKDPTRGGVAGVLHEMASKGRVGIVIDEAALPVRARDARCLRAGRDRSAAGRERRQGGDRRACRRGRGVLAALRAHPLGAAAAIIGVCTTEHAGLVVLDTGFGRRLVTEPEGELLPRIC